MKTVTRFSFVVAITLVNVCSSKALHEYFEDGALLLFNLKDDVREQNNLADTRPDKVRQMHELLLACAKRLVLRYRPKPIRSLMLMRKLRPSRMPWTDCPVWIDRAARTAQETESCHEKETVLVDVRRNGSVVWSDHGRG